MPANFNDVLREIIGRLRGTGASQPAPGGGLDPGWPEVERKRAALAALEAQRGIGVPPAPGYNMRPGRERPEDFSRMYGGAPFPPLSEPSLDQTAALIAALAGPPPLASVPAPAPRGAVPPVAVGSLGQSPMPPAAPLPRAAVPPVANGLARAPMPVAQPEPRVPVPPVAADPYAAQGVMDPAFLARAGRSLFLNSPTPNGQQDIERRLGEAVLKGAERARAGIRPEGQNQEGPGAQPPGEGAALMALIEARRGGGGPRTPSDQRRRTDDLNSYIAQMQAAGFPRRPDGGIVRNQGELDAFYRSQMAGVPMAPLGGGRASVRSADGSAPMAPPAPPSPPEGDGWVLTTHGLRRVV
jgi:hypothetical protein